MTGGDRSGRVGAVVAVGGGHGLAASLRAIRAYASSVTAVVSVADDGGSSGRLRSAMPDLPAPGDVRRCLGALAEPGSSLAAALEHRFGPADGALAGHAYGNLLLAALTFGLGSFTEAVREVSRLTGGAGPVLPATVGAVQLACRAHPGADGKRIVGQVAVANALGRRHLSLEPPAPSSPDEVRAAILAADQVVIGPGSLFTSVLAAAIVPAVRGALADTGAQRVYVANLGPQVPETAGFSLADHLSVLADHEIPVDVVLAAPGLDRDGGPHDGATVGGLPVLVRPVADDEGRVHDPARLAAGLRDVWSATPPVGRGARFAAPSEVN